MPESGSSLRTVTLLAFKLGCTAFGGPAAHIAMLRQDVVEKRRWLSDQRFLDLIGITNLIPGPNSTEMVMHIGKERAGNRGLVAAGAAFILPAALITLIFAWLYMEYGTTTQGAWVLRGIKPVVLAVVVQAIWNLGRTAFRTVPLAIVGAIVFALYLFGINEILLLFGGAIVVFLGTRLAASGKRPSTSSFIAPILTPGAFMAQAAADPSIPYTGLRLFLTFLKIGSVLYGSGYVLVAFIHNDFVERLGWLTETQLLDAVAVGQFTPGPVFTTATFVGYVVGGFTGAVVATLGIFLPAFIFVAVAHSLMNRLMALPWVRSLLDGVNVAAIGLMAAVAVVLARDAVVNVLTALLFVVAFILLIRFRVNSALLVAAGALVSIVWELAA
ncbi:MAG TPA: chromate efflux transporter [Thermomicrobiales bacterium]|jgi:chromate transporter|nr:chromate efflux transporter [Thermomicrobiales bacterium]